MSYFVPPEAQVIPPVIDGVPVHPEVHVAYLNSLKYRIRTDEFVLKPESLEQIENIVKEVEQQVHREPIVKKEVIPVPGPAGRIATVVKRLPTPEPDLLVKEYVIHPQKDTVNVIVEKPITPPPRFEQKQVVEDPGLPDIKHRIIQVPSSAFVPGPMTPLVVGPHGTAISYQDIPEGFVYPPYVTHRIAQLQTSETAQQQKQNETQTEAVVNTHISTDNLANLIPEAQLINADVLNGLIRLNPATSIFDVYGQN